jgi:hypothetical protein
MINDPGSIRFVSAEEMEQLSKPGRLIPLLVDLLEGRLFIETWASPGGQRIAIRVRKEALDAQTQ